MTYWNGSAWEAERPAAPRRRHPGRRLLGAAAEGSLVTLLLFGLVVGTALAAPGGGKGKGGAKTSGATVSVVVLDGADAAPNHRERITFEVVQSATDRPFVNLKCWQGSTGVYNASIGVFDSYLWNPWLTLDSSYWAAGVAADCHATAYYYDRRGNQRVLATLEVPVAP